MRSRYLAARWAGVHLVLILIASRSLRVIEHLAVGLKRQLALGGPAIKQPWITLELQQHGGNLLLCRHVLVCGMKACFPACPCGICSVWYSLHVSLAHMESRFANI